MPTKRGKKTAIPWQPSVRWHVGPVVSFAREGRSGDNTGGRKGPHQHYGHMGAIEATRVRFRPARIATLWASAGSGQADGETALGSEAAPGRDVS
jgi:hypothetical protein